MKTVQSTIERYLLNFFLFLLGEEEVDATHNICNFLSENDSDQISNKPIFTWVVAKRNLRRDYLSGGDTSQV